MSLIRKRHARRAERVARPPTRRVLRMSLIPGRRAKQGAKAGNHVEKAVHMLSMRRRLHTRRGVENPGSPTRVTAQITLAGRAFYTVPEWDVFSLSVLNSCLPFDELF